MGIHVLKGWKRSSPQIAIINFDDCQLNSFIRNAILEGHDSSLLRDDLRRADQP